MRAWLAAGAALCLALAWSPAQASIRVELQGVDGAVRDNVFAYLSLKRYATLDDLTADVVERIYQRGAGEIADALKPFGYYQPTVTGSLKAEGSNWVAEFVVAPGPPVVLTDASVTLTGPGADEPFLRELLDAHPLLPGSQLNHATYDRLRDELQRRATANGYLDAHFTANELLVDPAALKATASLALETGRRYRFGEVIIDQDAIDGNLVKRLLRFHAGDWYDSMALLRTQFALDDTRYFQMVVVLPGDRDSEQLTVPVHIDARRNDRHKYTIGAGYDTDFGARARITWDDRLLNRRGHRLHLETVVSQRAQSATATYIVPIGDPALEKAQVDLSGSDSSLADVQVKSIDLRPSVTRVHGRWQHVSFVDFLRTESRAGGVLSSDTLIVPGVSIAPLPPAFLGDAAGVGIGHGLFAEVLGSFAGLGSRSTFLRLHVRDDWRVPLDRRWHLLFRAELGATAVRDFNELPTQYRFFAGGDRSVRGFSFNSLSPETVVPATQTTAAQLLRTGGKHLAVASVELERDLPRGFAVAVFADAGNAFNRFGDPLEFAAGIGVRYKLPFVSVGLDIAQPLSRNGSPRLHLNISPVY
jgi:translocation and assembly module TamA